MINSLSENLIINYKLGLYKGSRTKLEVFDRSILF